MKFDNKHIALVFMLIISMANFANSHTARTLLSLKNKNSRKNKSSSKAETNSSSTTSNTTIKRTEKSTNKAESKSLAKNKNQKVQKKNKTKFFWFLVILIVLVVVAVAVKVAAKIIKHAFTYRAQRENLQNVEDAMKFGYLDKINTCASSKVAIIQNKALVQRFRMSFIPFKFSTVPGCNCNEKYENPRKELEGKSATEKKDYLKTQIEGEVEGTKIDCFSLCNVFNTLRTNGTTMDTQLLQSLQNYEANINLTCGWPEGSDPLNKLKDTIQAQVDSQVSIGESVRDVFASSIGSVANLLGAPGVADKIKGSKLGASAFGDSMAKLSQKTGMSIETASNGANLMANRLNEKYDVLKKLVEETLDPSKIKPEQKAKKSVAEVMTQILGGLSTVVGFIGAYVAAFTSLSDGPGAFLELVRAFLNLILALIALITKLTDTSNGVINNPVETMFEIFGLVPSIKDIVVAVLTLIQQSKAAAMTAAVFDLVIAVIELARSIYDYQQALGDAKNIENLAKSAFEQNRAKTCNNSLDTMNNAIKIQGMITALQDDKTELDQTQTGQFKIELKKNCYLLVRTCLSFGKSSQHFNHMEILEPSENQSMEWLVKNGPISDIAVSTHEDYDNDLKSNGYFQIEAKGIANSIFACRGCSVDKVISNLELKEKTNLSTGDYNRTVIHISYTHSLVFDVKSLSNTSATKTTESNLVKSFSIGDNYAINTELSSIEYDYNSEDKIIDVRVLTPPEEAIAHADAAGQTTSDIQIEQIVFNYCAEFCHKKQRLATHKCYAQSKKFLLFRFKSLILSKRNLKNAKKNKNSAAPEIVVLKSMSDFDEACKSCSRNSLSENVIIKPGTEVYSEDNTCEMELTADGELKINSISPDKNEAVLSAKPENNKVHAKLTNEGEFIVFSKTGTIWTGGRKVSASEFSHPFKAVVKSDGGKCKLFIVDSKDQSIWSNSK